MSDKIARPYAVAAFASARGDLLTEWGAHFSALAAAENALRSAGRGIGGAEKLRAALAESLGTKPGSLFDNFLTVLARAGRLNCLGAIARLFNEMRMEAGGVAAIRVETAAKMDLRARREFDLALIRWSGMRKAQVVYEHRPELLGGVRAHLKDNVLDASVLGRLQRLAAALG